MVWSPPPHSARANKIQNKIEPGREPDFTRPVMKKESCPHRNATLALLFFGLVTCSPSLRAQSVPASINYQGKLVDAAANPLPDGAYELVFRVWDQADSNEPR